MLEDAKRQEQSEMEGPSSKNAIMKCTKEERIAWVIAQPKRVGFLWLLFPHSVEATRLTMAIIGPFPPPLLLQ